MSIRTSSIVLLCVIVVSFSVGAVPQESPEDSTTLRKLHAERVAALAYISDIARQNYNVGQGTHLELLKAEVEVNRARLDAAATRKERLGLLQRDVRLLKDIEERAKAQIQTGLLTAADVQRAKAIRLKAEIDLLTETMR